MANWLFIYHSSGSADIKTGKKNLCFLRYRLIVPQVLQIVFWKKTISMSFADLNRYL